MKKILLAVMLAFSTAVYADTDKIISDENTFKTQENQKETSQEVLFAVKTIPFVAIGIGLIISLVIIRRKKTSRLIGDFEKQDQVKIARGYVETLLTIEDDIQGAVKFNIDCTKLDALVQPIVGLIPQGLDDDTYDIEQVQSFNSAYEQDSAKIHDLYVLVRNELYKYTRADNFLKSISPSEIYVRDYAEMVAANFKPIFTDDELDVILPKLMRDYRVSIKEHVDLRHQLSDIITSGKSEEIEAQIDLISKNIDAIANHERLYNLLVREDRRKVYLGEHAKTLIMKKAESLLSYCNAESNSTEEELTHARSIIENVLEEAITIKPDNTIENYAIFVTLSNKLEEAKIPYLNACKKDILNEELHVNTTEQSI